MSAGSTILVTKGPFHLALILVRNYKRSSKQDHIINRYVKNSKFNILIHVIDILL